MTIAYHKIALVLLCYPLLLAGACAVQERFLYFPNQAQIDPSRVLGDQVYEKLLHRSKNLDVVTWRAEPARSGGPVVLYFHGNRANLANRADHFRRFLDAGWGLAALSYRGYGGSGGRPSERANVGDALALYDELASEGVSPNRIIVYGESLGSGVAVQVAAARPVGAVVLHAPYDTVEDVAARIAPFLFPRVFLRDRYRSIDHIANVDAPILWLHGDKDRVIPLSHGQRLYDAARAPKTAVIVPGFGHRDVFDPALFASETRPFVEAVMAGGYGEMGGAERRDENEP